VFKIRRELCAPCGRTNRTDYIAALRTLACFGVHAYWFWCSLSVTPITESPKKRMLRQEMQWRNGTVGHSL